MADLNMVALTGRLTKDIELRKTTTGKDVCSFTLACNRVKKKDEEKAAADYISCTAWNSIAKFVSEYCHKGDFVTVRGSIQTGSYKNQLNETVWTTQVLCEQINLPSGRQFKKEEKKEEKPAEEPKKVAPAVDPYGGDNLLDAPHLNHDDLNISNDDLPF